MMGSSRAGGGGVILGPNETIDGFNRKKKTCFNGVKVDVC